MSDYQITAGYKGKDAQHILTLHIISFEEDGLKFMYSPALDITGYGKSESEAKKSFHITLQEFMRYADNKNTFIKELRKHGWTVKHKGKQIKGVSAPTMIDMLEKNEEFNKIVSEKPYKQVIEKIAV